VASHSSAQVTSTYTKSKIMVQASLPHDKAFLSYYSFFATKVPDSLFPNKKSRLLFKSKVKQADGIFIV